MLDRIKHALMHDGFIISIFFLQIIILFLGEYITISPIIAPWLYFATSLYIGIWVILKFLDHKAVLLDKKDNRKYKHQKFVLLGSALVVIILTLGFINNKMQQFPIDPELSDVIPTVQELTQRFVNGTYVYEPIEKFGYHLPVTYLPMQWAPYLLPEVAGFDYRWLTLVIFFGCVILILFQSMQLNSIWHHIITTVLLMLSYVFITYYNTGVHLHTFELLIVSYYVLLLLAINNGHPIWQGLMVGICLMSRYSLVLWLPMAIIVLCLNKDKKHIITVAATTLIFILVIYVLPFLSKDWMIFYNGYKYYDNSAIGEWEHLNPVTNKPYHLYNGFGFAHVVYQNFLDWTLIAKIKLLQKLHLFISIGTSIVLIIYYFKNKHRIDYKVFLLASLKIYLAIFYFLIQVPYMYLMLVDFFVGVALYAIQSRYTLIPISNKK